MADTLLFWHPTENTTITTLLPASAVPGSSTDAQLRVRNDSVLYQARAVAVSASDTGTPASPSVAAMHLFSLDGLTFTATVNLGDLHPGAVSPPITVRRVVPSTATTGTYQWVMNAHAASWA